jgi:hypothetical protein
VWCRRSGENGTLIYHCKSINCYNVSKWQIGNRHQKSFNFSISFESTIPLLETFLNVKKNSLQVDIEMYAE